MKILYTLNSGNPGGMEQHVLDLVNQMTARGNDVYVWCRSGIIYDWYKRAGAKVTERAIRNDFDINYIKDLSRFLKDNRIQIIHAHELKAVTNSLLAGFLAGVKVRVSHQHTPFSNWQVSKSIRLIYDVCYSILVIIFGTTEISLTDSIKSLKMRAGIPSKKLSVIPNGIGTYRFYVAQNEKEIYRREICKKHHIDPSNKIVGNLSRTTKEKGHDLLIKAFAKLINEKTIERDKYMLLICGGGDLEESLWNLAGDLRIKDRIVITGRFDEDMKTKFYSAFDYFVFPTRAEGFGIVLIESLVMELPTLCSDLTVLKEVGKDFPLYFKDGSVDDLADKMQKMLSGAHRFENKASQKDFVERNYSLEKFGDNYQKLYESMLSL